MLRGREARTLSTILWTPDPARVEAGGIRQFIRHLHARGDTGLSGFADLHRFALDHPGRFWHALADFADIRAESWGDVVLADAERMPGARWFPQARLNYAENLLRRRDDTEAIVFQGEGRFARRLTFAELYDAVSCFEQALRAHGIGVGDRICAVLPNTPEAIVAMLATAAIGAVWSSCSPDFGVRAILERFGQIEPRVLIVGDVWLSNGRLRSTLNDLDAILAGLPSVERVVVAPYGADNPPTHPDGEPWEGFVGEYAPHDIAFARLPFDHPLFVLFSSGTTGAPKCIVHGAGGTLLEHVKEHRLHCDVKAGDRVFYYTTTGWMMWNWLASALASEATLLLHDGSPFRPGRAALFDFAARERMTLFGTAAKYLDTARRLRIDPPPLPALRTITSTGSPLSPECFDYVYDHVKKDVHLASISGGTDIIGCFVLGDPTAPVRRGEIQAASLGMDIDILDAAGASLRGAAGELVCRNPFPSMPIRFWNDPGNARYQAAYFDRYPGIWHHGDWAEFTEAGGIVIHGRSDAVLNPGGVRIGTAEIYNSLSTIEGIEDAVVVGQQWKSDVRVVLFVKLIDHMKLDGVLQDHIRGEIRAHCSPAHVPDKVIRVADIPRTMNGKTSEIAVRNAIHGRPVGNRDALQNPDSLDHFHDLPELR